MTEYKILVCGDVNGNFRSLFSKVTSIVKKKGPFEYLFCLGNFFGSSFNEWEEVKSGKIAVPLTTYVLGANEPSHANCYTSSDLATNVVYLGKKGCLTGSSGLKIAYLSGLEESNITPTKKETAAKNKNSISFSKDDVIDLTKSLESEAVIDILLTSQWPKDVAKYAVSPDIDEAGNRYETSALISYLAKVLKPRFHFSALAGIYYERIPYRNHTVLQEKNLHVTRFIGLAPLSSLFQKKHKWLYAVNIIPAHSLSRQQLTQYSGPVTNCPYDFSQSDFENQSVQFFYERTSSMKNPHSSKEDYGTKKKKTCNIDSSKCWFCLSNALVEKHLIINIGSQCYVTLPKGVLVPEHVLIVPVKHVLSSIELPNIVTEEIDKFKESLASYFNDNNKDMVLFERNYCSPHLQLQIIPIPKNLESDVKEELFSAARKQNLKFTEIPPFASIQEVATKNKPYFYFELIIDRKSVAKYLHIIEKKFPLQFGRELLASSKILNVPERIDWKQCHEGLEEEKKMAEDMRKCFASYFNE